MLTFIEKFSNALLWLRIAASPILAGIIIGVIIKFSIPGPFGIISGIVILLIGLILGYRFAEYTRKKKGSAANFLGKLNDFTE